MIKLLGIGDNTIDIYVDKQCKFPGGNAVNVAVFSARLGADCSYLGCLGDDDNAKLLSKAMQNENINIDHVRKFSNTENSWSKIKHKSNDRIFVESYCCFKSGYDLKKEDYDYIKTHHIVHSSIYSYLENDLEKIRKASKYISYDFSDDFNEAYIKDNATHIDFAFLSAPRLNLKEAKDLCKFVASLGPILVIVTRGKKKVVVYNDISKDFYFHEIDLSYKVIDTLGAGDAFISAFLVSYFQKKNIQTSLLLACDFATKACLYYGAFGYGKQMVKIYD